MKYIVYTRLSQQLQANSLRRQKVKLKKYLKRLRDSSANLALYNKNNL